MADFDFDFGFTAVTEDELEVVQQQASAVQETTHNLETLQNKIDTLYNMFQPLLNNLKANPQKDYIYWPNRLDKVESFSDELDKVYNS